MVNFNSYVKLPEGILKSLMQTWCKRPWSKADVDGSMDPKRLGFTGPRLQNRRSLDLQNGCCFILVVAPTVFYNQDTFWKPHFEPCQLTSSSRSDSWYFCQGSCGSWLRQMSTKDVHKPWNKPWGPIWIVMSYWRFKLVAPKNQETWRFH